jgi:hypothetical protein
MEQENEARLLPLDPHRQTIRDLQMFMLQQLNDGYTVNLAIDGNESDTHLYCPRIYNSRLTTPLGFDYDSRISGSITEIIEAYDLVNIHTIQHGEAPAMHKQGSQQIDFNFISRSLVMHVEDVESIDSTNYLQCS